ncbi:hypothetical protein HDU67_006930 [Dinochytrium kinnereticum]|nr:hypothetical protein HDU67_006930 [Dinochytrium kinnereticum]
MKPERSPSPVDHSLRSIPSGLRRRTSVLSAIGSSRKDSTSTSEESRSDAIAHKTSLDFTSTTVFPAPVASASTAVDLKPPVPRSKPSPLSSTSFSSSIPRSTSPDPLSDDGDSNIGDKDHDETTTKEEAQDQIRKQNSQRSLRSSFGDGVRQVMRRYSAIDTPRLPLSLKRQHSVISSVGSGVACSVNASVSSDCSANGSGGLTTIVPGSETARALPAGAVVARSSGNERVPSEAAVQRFRIALGTVICDISKRRRPAPKSRTGGVFNSSCSPPALSSLALPSPVSSTMASPHQQRRQSIGSPTLSDVDLTDCDGHQLGDFGHHRSTYHPLHQQEGGTFFHSFADSNPMLSASILGLAIQAAKESLSIRTGGTRAGAVSGGVTRKSRSALDADDDDDDGFLDEEEFDEEEEESKEEEDEEEEYELSTPALETHSPLSAFLPSPLASPIAPKESKEKKQRCLRLINPALPSATDKGGLDARSVAAVAERVTMDEDLDALIDFTQLDEGDAFSPSETSVGCGNGSDDHEAESDLDPMMLLKSDFVSIY